MKIIDNVSDLLGDDLKREITPGSKVRIAASAFSIFAFEALRKDARSQGRPVADLAREVLDGLAAEPVAVGTPHPVVTADGRS